MSERIVLKSVIGSHRLKSKKMPRILFPYYQNYKPVYRARNSRTPKWCWPEIDKYPYHTHQKRFPSKNEINIEHFAEFCKRDEKKLTLFELLHTLPNYGVNCLVYKPNICNNTQSDQSISHNSDNGDADSSAEKKNHRTLNIDNNTYIIKEQAKNNLYYYIKQASFGNFQYIKYIKLTKVKYKIRPFKAKITSHMYYNDKLLKKDISPNGAVRGIWRYILPCISDINKHIYRPPVHAPYSDIIIGH